MIWEEYLSYFKELITSENQLPPYNDPLYLDYTRLNWSRTNRWIKQNPITEDTYAVLKSIPNSQHWVVITEPWCGDAAHIVPILYLMSRSNEKIDFTIQLRDTDSEISNYLTNGTKSIPILIARDASNNDLFHWGPRPEGAKELFAKLNSASASFEILKVELQHWYNKDNSLSIQKEIIALLKKQGNLFTE